MFPNGIDPYLCSWDPDTEWDVEMEQDVGVSYREPGGDRVFAVFRVTSEVFLPGVLRSYIP